MAEQILSTNDSEVWLGWPTEDTGDAYVQLGVLHGDQSAWAQLDSDSIDELRRHLQRAKRRVYGRTDAAEQVSTRRAIALELAAANEKLAETRDSLVEKLRVARAQHGQIERPEF